MTTWTNRLVGDFPSDKLDCIPFVPHYWGNSITAWQNKEVIPIGIKDVHAAGLDGKHYLLKTHDPSLARNMQRTLDDIFIIKVSGFPGSTYMKYGHVSTFLPTSTVAIEMLRAIRREPIEAPWSGDWPALTPSSRLNFSQSSSNERFKGSRDTDGPGFYKW